MGRPGCLRMDIVAHGGALVREKADFKSLSLVFDAAIANSPGLTPLVREEDACTDMQWKRRYGKRKPSMAANTALPTNSIPRPPPRGGHSSPLPKILSRK